MAKFFVAKFGWNENFIMARKKKLYKFFKFIIDIIDFIIAQAKDRLWAAMFLSAEATHLAAPAVLVTL